MFDFRYLEDPKNSQGNLDEPAKISSIVNEDLADDEPVVVLVGQPPHLVHDVVYLGLDEPERFVAELRSRLGT